MNALDQMAATARQISAIAEAVQRDLREIRAMAEDLARREQAAGVSTADQTEDKQ